MIWLEGLTENWEDELNSLANQSYDHTVSLTFLRCRYDTYGRYQLFGVVNHIALDGLGFVKALHTFYNYLGEMTLCTNCNAVTPADRRSFIDVFARNPILQSSLFNFMHNYLPPQERDSNANDIQSLVASSQGQMIGLFKKFDRATTSKLLAYAKARSTTVQGMLSIAAVDHIDLDKKSTTSTSNLDIELVCDQSSSICTTSLLIRKTVFQHRHHWLGNRKCKEHSSIWYLAQDASNLLHRHNNQPYGLAFSKCEKVWYINKTTKLS